MQPIHMKRPQPARRDPFETEVRMLNTQAVTRLPRVRMFALAGVLALVALLAPAVAHAAVYNPLNIISYDTWRASKSMSVADIQAFLDSYGGPLKTLVTTDYVTPGGADAHGVPWTAGQPSKSAAQIIYDASTYWNINPKVILATLQKEQSLIEHSDSASQNQARLIKAMGCGVYGAKDPNTGLTTNRFPGFGNQIFNGARVFSTYEISYNWVPGMTKTVTVSATGHYMSIVPLNACTFALYTYTPYYPQISFWNLYVKYFGDPLTPPRFMPVYRFRNKSNGTYYLTSSEAKRYSLVRKSSKKWSFQGVGFQVDTSSTANTVPLYQLYNSHTHKYYYTISTAKRDSLVRKHWHVDGAVCLVAAGGADTAPVFGLEKKSTHGILLTPDASAKTSLTTGHSPKYKYRGVFFFLGTYVETSPTVGPTS